MVYESKVHRLMCFHKENILLNADSSPEASHSPSSSYPKVTSLLSFNIVFILPICGFCINEIAWSCFLYSRLCL